ncbi:MAG: GreA/GreB family elongation factor [Kiritimatiellae bacterium]|nr:GreA/GreB family elongation factor [Kiritimatiellia bacterium]MDD5522149.1 GreA/GreB family elongation factor [Kiritimatiellia bacterium]
MPKEIKDRNDSELEAWFLDALAAEKLPLDHMLVLLAQFGANEKTGMANSWVGLLQDTLMERGDKFGMFRLMKTVYTWRKQESVFFKTCKDALASVFKDRLGTGFLGAAGFDQNLPVSECLRRFEVLIELKSGQFCYDKTWGFGIVQRLDDFYQKIVINFDKKKGHQMSFVYAGEALEIIGNDHILTVQHNDPVKLAELVKNNPAEVVKMAIRSYGPASAPRLRELLVPDPVKPDEWKIFWDEARKMLKDDLLIDLPTKRNDPIHLREKHREYDEEWFAAFRSERDVDRVLELVAELEASTDDVVKTGRQWKEFLTDRFAFVVKGCFGKRPDIIVRVVMFAKRFGLDRVEDGGIDGIAITRSLFAPEQFLLAISKIPARDLNGFVQYMSACDAKLTADVILSLIPQMAINVLNEGITFLLQTMKEDDCAELFRSRLMTRTASPSMLLWVCRNLDRAATWELVNISELLAQVIDDLKETKSGDDLKSQNQLKLLLTQKAWLEKVLARMSADQRADFIIRLNISRVLDDAAKRSALALMIKIYPELKDILSSKDEQPDETIVRRGRFTSWRSYRERQEQYKILIEKTIPANSRDIAIARSYGDLRENHEYKTAKEMQGIFLKRQGEIERDLQVVKGTDFAGIPVNRVGMGTFVTIRRPNGSEQTFAVLGEWDRDEKLGIISSESKLAKLMEGRQEGDEVTLPASGSGDGEERCEIVKVMNLPDEIKQWVAGTAEQEK